MVRVRHRLWANVGASLATVGYSNNHRHSCICLWFRAEAAPFALPSRFRSQPSAFEWRQKCQRTLVILRIIAVAVDNLLAFALVRVFDQSREMREALLRLVKCDLNTSGPRARPEHYR